MNISEKIKNGIHEFWEFLESLEGLTIDDMQKREIKEHIRHVVNMAEVSTEADDDEDLLERPKYSPGTPIIDQRHLLNRPARKWYRNRETKKIGICFHHTAVKGGFGIHRSTLATFNKIFTAPGSSEAGRLGKRIGLANCHPVNLNKTPEELAKIQALAARYRGAGQPGKYNKGVPYHAIFSREGNLYLNLPFDWVTWHGNGANTDYLGFAWDGRSGVDTYDPIALVNAITALCEKMKAEGHTVEKFTIHSAWTRKPSDPGSYFLQDVIMPAAEIVGAELDRERHNKYGKSIDDLLK